MKNLQEATERICELKGNLLALDALVTTMLRFMPEAMRDEMRIAFAANAELARTALLNADISELTLAAFEHDVTRTARLIGAVPPAPPS
jgi:hypothetical protein